MPSPFPGMDPYLEDMEWEDFHMTFNTVIRECLALDIQPKYAVRIERRIYVEHGLEDDDQVRFPDVSVLWTENEHQLSPAKLTSVGTSLAPIECLIPSPQERRETYLVIRQIPSLEIVTVIETPSPANKRASSDGRDQYLAKREEILRSKTNLVELDFLRGGKRLPLINTPPGDYYAIVSRGTRRPKVDVFAWTIRHPLPTIRIPLKPGDPEPELNLQQVFDTVVDRARYHLTIDYTAALRLPLNEADEIWKRQLVSTRT